MHDPQVVAFRIPSPRWRYRPWPRDVRNRAERLGWDAKRAWDALTPQQRQRRHIGWPDGYREDLVTVWHVDPERDGSDDSCGWTTPKLTYSQRERLRSLAWNEARNPYFIKRSGKEWKGTRHKAECLYRGLLLQIAHYLRIKMTFEQAAKEAALMIHNPDVIDGAAKLCFQPGWHTNFDQDDLDQRQDYFFGLICGIAMWMLKDRRPWWKHPRWHVLHWKRGRFGLPRPIVGWHLQVHPLQSIQRRYFDRCEECGKRFAKGESVFGTVWDHPRQPWWRFWRSSKHIRHSRCLDRSCQVDKEPSSRARQ